MNKNKIEELIDYYDLSKHPEGGYFKEVFRSKLEVYPNYAKPEPRSASSSIYFLLPSDKSTIFHRIKTEEVWNFYEGDPMHVVILSNDSKDGVVLLNLGTNFREGQVRQAVVPANSWFSSFIPMPSSGYSFTGCSVSPGFEFRDYESGKKQELLKEFPKASEYIEKLFK